MNTNLWTASFILGLVIAFHPLVYCQDQPDFTCKRFTIDGDVQLREDDTIMVTANSLQSIVCKNNTSEISDIAYNFNPPNAAVRSSEVYYIPPHKYEKKFFLDSSATLTIRGINSTNNNDANYTLEINFQVVQEPECSSAPSISFSPSHKKVHWLVAILIINLWCKYMNIPS